MLTKKVAVYASSCTNENDAIQTQIKEAINKIICEQDWHFNIEKDVYSDIGSKSQIKGRPALEELIQKAKQGEYNLIVVRDTSRLVRNDKLLYELVSDLKEYGVDFYFMLGNILTSDEKDYFNFIIHASSMCETKCMSVSKRAGMDEKDDCKK